MRLSGDLLDGSDWITALTNSGISIVEWLNLSLVSTPPAELHVGAIMYHR